MSRVYHTLGNLAVAQETVSIVYLYLVVLPSEVNRTFTRQWNMSCQSWSGRLSTTQA